MKKRLAPHIAIIGAEISGIAAAQRLQAKGYHVTVFEQAGRVGGKCYSHQLEGNTYDLGAATVALSFKQILRMVRQAKASLQPASPYQIAFSAIELPIKNMELLFIL